MLYCVKARGRRSSGAVFGLFDAVLCCILYIWSYIERGCYISPVIASVVAMKIITKQNTSKVSRFM